MSSVSPGGTGKHNVSFCYIVICFVYPYMCGYECVMAWNASPRRTCRNQVSYCMALGICLRLSDWASHFTH